MSKKLKVISIIALSLIVLIVSTFFFGTRGMDVVGNYTFDKVDLSKVEDGNYEGSFNKTRWGLAVKVRVESNLIKGIDITDRKSSNINKDLVSKINSQLIDKEMPIFDVITGASMTSKGYLIAVAEALKEK